jgi:uncharacterized protein YbjT (DUF2867 family)
MWIRWLGMWNHDLSAGARAVDDHRAIVAMDGVATPKSDAVVRRGEMRVVVTGGLGALGSLVVEHLREADHEAVPASRRTGVDLATGTGLQAVLAGADAVVHTADTTKPWQFGRLTVGGTRRLAQAVASMDRPAHLIAISIVGCDRSPYAYYRAKTRAEYAIEAADIRATVLRATQFHSLVAAIARAATKGPVAFAIRGVEFQPVDREFVAARLAALAVGPPPSGFRRAVDVAGPERLSMGHLARLVAAHELRRSPRIVPVPAVGGSLRALAAGHGLPSGEAELGGIPFGEWLSRQPVPMRGR